MTWISNSTRAVGWLCALLFLSTLLPAAPVRADDPLTPSGADPQPPDSAAEPEPLAQVPVEVERALRAHLEAHDLVVFQRAQGDLDGDGLIDLVAHVGRVSPEDGAGASDVDVRSAVVVVVGDHAARRGGGAAVAVDLSDGMLCPSCPIGEPGLNCSLPEQTLHVRDGRIELCEAWGKSWYARECGVLRLLDGALRLEQHSETSGWTRGPSEHTLEFDFVEHTGRRAYLSHPIEAGYPIIERSARFALLAALHADEEPVLDGELDEPPWQGLAPRPLDSHDWLVSGAQHWEGPEDLAFTVRTLWRDDALWLAVEVDDDLAVRTACDDLGAPMQADRLELWLDLANDTRVSGNDEHVEAHRRVYLEDPVRHDPDEHVVQLVLAPRSGGGVCAARRLPRAGGAGNAPQPDGEATDVDATDLSGGDVPSGDELAPPAVGSVVGAPGEVRVALVEREGGAGYTAEIVLPAAFFGAESLSDYEGRGYGLGLSVLAHDLDDPRRPQDGVSMATSTLRWGDPFTFGLLVMPRQALELPLFPFAWSDWIE